MASKLKAVSPEIVKAGKPKFLISGMAGVGKTFCALSFPKVYYIDTEGGAVQPQYRKKLKESGGVYFGKDEGSQDIQAVVDEVKALATETHEFKTLVIDSFSKLYLNASAEAEAKGGSEFGRDKKMANIPTRQLVSWINKLDMNVLLIAHSKPLWEKSGKETVNAGTTFEGYENKMNYELDLWLEVIFKDGQRYGKVRKSRLETFPLDQVFEWDYSQLAKRFDEKVLDRKPEAVKMATPEQVEKVKGLLAVVKVPEGWVDKAFDKYSVTDWSEMQSEVVSKAIEYLEKILRGGK